MPSLRFLMRFLSFSILILSFSIGYANMSPSKPGNLIGVAKGSSSVELTWDASTDDKRVRYYQISVDQIPVATTRKLKYTVSGLQADTEYQFDVEANDGQASSYTATVRVATSEDSASEQPTPVDPEPIDCRGKNKRLPECQNPSEEEPPVEEPPVEEPPVEEPIGGSPPEGWQTVFVDDFDGTGDLDTTSASKLWRFETLSDALHRAGNTGVDEFGNTDGPAWLSPNGKRWSGWYNAYNQDNAYRSNGNLVMQGLLTDEVDPTRPNDYFDNGVLTQYGSGKLYTAWLDTWSRKYDNNLERHITDPASPNKTFKYGYFEARVNFSQMNTPGFRLSLWLMPASIDADGEFLVASDAYDANGDNGVEIDIFEYEWISEVMENRLQLSIHGGVAGGSSTNFDTESVGVSIHEGWHTVGLLWEADKLQWSLDGQVIKTVTNPSLIPDVYSYMILSREMNSGVKTPGIDVIEEGDALEVLPYRPRDPGLYAQNIWEYRSRIATDRALVDYIKVWQP